MSLGSRTGADIGGAALLWSHTARAQIPVTDAANLANTTRQVIQSAQQVQQLINQLAVMQQQYAQLIQTYQAIAHLPDTALQQLAAQLNVQQFRTPLPTTSSMVGGLMNGTGLNQLGTVGQQFLSQNRLYVPSGTHFAARQLTGTANSIAGVQGMLNNLYQSASGRITTLQGLEGQLSSAKDAKPLRTSQPGFRRNQPISRPSRSKPRCFRPGKHRRSGMRPSKPVSNAAATSTRCSPSRSKFRSVSPPPQAIAAGRQLWPARGDQLRHHQFHLLLGCRGKRTALGTMMGQDWGSAAASNASAMGVIRRRWRPPAS